jgi:hypothetical protein
VFLRLLEQNRIQQSSVVVVEFDNHEILAISQLGPRVIVLPKLENQTVDFYFTPVPAFLHSVRSVAIFLHRLHVSLLKPDKNVTIGAEHCRAGYVQA